MIPDGFSAETGFSKAPVPGAVFSFQLLVLPVLIFFYDKTFDGLLTAIFDAYSRRTFPDRLLQVGEPAPLFADETYTVVTDPTRAERVRHGLMRKLPAEATTMILRAWLSEQPAVDELLFRYIRKTFDATESIALNFADLDVLEVRNLALKVSREAHKLKQFVRFSKTADGIYVAPIRPVYNALPLIVPHFTDRFADQPWMIYDIRRRYGYHYDLHTTREVTLSADTALRSRLDPDLLAADEQRFQDLWRAYFRSLTIRERLNPRKQRQDMPVRFWPHLTEMQPDER